MRLRVTDYNPKIKINLIKVARQLEGLGLPEAKRRVESLPFTVEVLNVNPDNIKDAQRTLDQCGSEVSYVWDPAPQSGLPTILVREGPVQVTSIHGEVSPNGFVLFISLHEKYVEAYAHTENPGRVLLTTGSRTLRDGEPFSAPEGTEIEISGSWYIEVSVGGYTCRVVGYAASSDLPLSNPLPFTRVAGF